MLMPEIVMAVGDVGVAVQGRPLVLHTAQMLPPEKATLLMVACEPSAATTPATVSVQPRTPVPMWAERAPLAVKFVPVGEMVAAEAAPARAAQAAARHRTFEVFMASFPVMRGATSRLGLNRAAPSR